MVKKRKVLVTGIPGPRLFYAAKTTDFSIAYGRRKEIRTFEDLLDDSQLCGNTGNLLIGEGAVSAFSEHDCTYLPFSYLYGVMDSPERLEMLRERFDLVVLATANLLRPGYSAHAEADLLEKIDLPTLVLGVGLQVQSKMADIPEGTMRLVRLLADKGHHAFTRGIETRDYLKAQGVENATATGCPSIYLRPVNMVEALRRLKDIGHFHFRSVMVGGYLGSMKSSNEDIKLMSSVSRSVAYVLQDEFLHYGLTFDQGRPGARVYESSTGEIKLGFGHKRGDEPATRLAPEYKPTSVHAFLDNDDWRQWSEGHDLFFGRRFHGGVAAMQAGVPALFVSIDDRMREMLSFAGLPYIDGSALEGADKVAVLRKFVEDYDPVATVRAYEEREADFRQNVNRLLQ